MSFEFLSSLMMSGLTTSVYSGQNGSRWDHVTAAALASLLHGMANLLHQEGTTRLFQCALLQIHTLRASCYGTPFLNLMWLGWKRSQMSRCATSVCYAGEYIFCDRNDNSMFFDLVFLNLCAMMPCGQTIKYDKYLQALYRTSFPRVSLSIITCLKHV